MRSLAKGVVLAAALLALGADPLIMGVPGVVILEPGVDPSSRGLVIARKLAAAGYATIIATGNPLAAAQKLRARPGVRADDIALIGFGNSGSSVLATIVEPYALDVAHQPVFRSAIAFNPDCARRYGDWTGSLPARRSGTAGAPHGGGPEPGLFRNATPLLIVDGQGACRDLARYSYEHEYFVDDVSAAGFDEIATFIAENAQYSVVSFPSSQSGTTLTGELTVPYVAAPVPVVIISPGTAGIEGFPFWERPWARRLLDLGYASLIVDSYLSRHSSWKDHWRIDARTVKAREPISPRNRSRGPNRSDCSGARAGERPSSPRSCKGPGRRRLRWRSPIMVTASSATARGRAERRRRARRLPIVRMCRC
jgi:dienelactone hydrolase